MNQWEPEEVERNILKYFLWVSRIKLGPMFILLYPLVM